jgi:predicted transporter
MALIQCSECGRSVSDKAKACVGCGAPIDWGANALFASAPQPSKAPALTRRALRWRALLASVTFIVGLTATIEVRGGNQTVTTLATLLLIVGLCWLIVAILQNVMAARKR